MMKDCASLAPVPDGFTFVYPAWIPISGSQDLCAWALVAKPPSSARIANVLCTERLQKFEGLKKRPNIGVTPRNAMALRRLRPPGGLPFCGPPSIFTAIVKQFTSDTSSDTCPQFPAPRRSPAMRFALLTTVVAIGAVACGKKDQNQTQTQRAPPPAPAAAAPAGPVVEVKMTGNGSTRAAFEPSTITVPAGATVRFINVAGGPHNITFWSDSVPAGGAAALQAGMKNTVDNLSGPFLVQPNETYEVSFANAPKGTYKGFCTPHLTLGMKIAIKVE